VPVDGGGLVIGDDLLGQPDPAEPPEQLGMRAWRDKMRVRDRVHLVLDPRAVPDHLVAPCHKPPPAFGACIGQPDLGQKAGCPQRCQTGEGQIVLVWGEPGIGKSRLTAALSQSIQSSSSPSTSSSCTYGAGSRM